MSTIFHQRSSVLLRKLLVSYLLAAALEFLLLPDSFRDLSGLDGVAAMSLPRLLGIWAAGFLLLFFLAKHIPAPAERWAMAVLTGLLSFFAWRSNRAVPFLWACVLMTALVLIYAVFGWNETAARPGPDKGRSRLCRLLALGLGLLFFAFVSAWTVARITAYHTPSYDFGIFSQMFHHMRKTGLPNTTLERDGLLSHFKVHVSPIYYLLLPVYWVFPYPATLQILQAALMASAALPLWLLGKQRGFPPPVRLLFCGVLLLYPAYASAASYDIHENCFLTPLLLWLFYGLERRSLPLTVVFGLLTLCVKEDAAVYTAVAAVYLLLRGTLRREDRLWQLSVGTFLLASSVGWFLGVTTYLAGSGDGVMTYRYSNFMYDGTGTLGSVILCALLCPAKVLFECVDPEKLGFLAVTMVPLLGLPLMTRRYERLVLLVPYVLLNLMSDYQYQHDIFFQYTFGSIAFLFYLSLLNFSDLWGRLKKKAWLPAAALAPLLVLCVIGFVRYPVPRARAALEACRSQRAQLQAVERALSAVEEQDSVTASTFYTTPLSRRMALYDLRYASEEHIFSTDLIVLDPRYSGDYGRWATDAERTNGFARFRLRLEALGYRLEGSVEGRLLIYRRPAAPD